MIRNIIFQQDGAPAHNSIQVKEYLNETFGNLWIGTNGPVQWPPRSPDLTPMDFFLWGYIKNEVYKNTYHNIEALQFSVRNALYSINRMQFQNTTRRGVLKRVNLCIQENGSTIEHLIR